MPNVGYGALQVIPSMRGIEAMLRRQLVEPAADAGDQAGQQAGSSLKDRLAAGAKVAGVAAGALLVKGIGDAIGQLNAASKLQAQLGSTSKVAAAHGKIAGKLYGSGVSDSFQSAADAIKAVVQAGLAPPGTTNAQLQKIATKASDVATVFDQDLGGVTNAVGQFMRTGLAKNAGQAFDLITRGFQSGADKGGDFLDTINEYGTQFRKAGLDGRTAIGLLNQAIRAGARDSDVAADAIKEFSIRAVDGSKSTATGFKALGLNADSMAAKFAKGGKSANGVLDLTLDRLRRIKDPVKQSQIAVQLFGTQAEDLGAALLAMDPSKAAAGLGKVGGAADRMGKTMRSGPTHEIEVFTRSVQQGFTNAVGTYVIPVLGRLGHALNATVVPAVRAVLPPVKAFFAAFVGSPAAMNALAVVLSLLVARFVALKAVAGGQAVVAGLRGMAASAAAGAAQVRFLAFAVRYYTVIAAQAIVQAVRTGAAWVASGARAAGAWIVARARAVAAFAQTAASAVVNAVRASAAWVASGARAAGTWALMRARAVGAFAATAASAVTNAARTGAAWVAAQLRSAAATVRATATLVAQRVAMVAAAVATRAMAAGQWLLNAAMRANPIGLIITGLMLLGGALVLAYKKSSTFRMIVQGAMRGVMVAVRAVGAAAMWLWRNALAPAFRGIGSVVRWIWNSVVRPYFALWRLGFRALGAVGKWLYENAIRPAMRGIGSVVTWLYRNGIKPWLDKGKAAVRLFGIAFRLAKDAIATQWAKLRSATRKPVQFVIDTVYNNGIRKVWNAVAGFVGMKKLGVVKFASGGSVWGPGTETSDSVPALLSRNEHVWTAAEVRGAGGHGAVEALRALAARGGLGFAKGGAVDWFSNKARTVGSWVGKGVDFLANPGKIWQKMTGFIRDKLRDIGTTRWTQAVAAVPKKMLAALKGKIVSAASSFFGGAGGNIGGSGVKRWAPLVLRALRMLGQPASWLNTVLRRMNQESGGNPRAMNAWDSNAAQGYDMRSKGLMQTIGPTFRAHAGPFRKLGIWNPMANIYAGLHYALARYGSLAALNRPGGYDSGGMLPPGYSTVYNGTRRPEAVLTSQQWNAVVSGNTQPRQVHVMQGAQVYPREAVDVDMLAQRLEFAARAASF